MCIRDRAHTNVPGARHRKRWEDVLELLDEGINVISAVNVPVSYTHLRAHETVLDLVCRLLLEKKKNKPRGETKT